MTGASKKPIDHSESFWAGIWDGYQDISGNKKTVPGDSSGDRILLYLSPIIGGHQQPSQKDHKEFARVHFF